MFFDFIKRQVFIRQFVKFCVVGGLAAVINFILLYALTEWFGIWYVISSAFGGVISAIWNFLANKFWTFRNRDRGRQALEQMFKFIVVIGSGVVVNTLLVYLFTDFGGLDYRWSWVLATGVVTFWNFGFNRFWTFGAKSGIDPKLLSGSF
ncbi:MAG: GtrA family protein [Patescibacteria group bacterium]|jgi:putative flippase GtrA|nr:GtrA family protein [Patescibacteria group bacterium]